MTFIKPERHFSTFSKNNTQPPSIVFLIKSYNFHEKSWVFLKHRKKVDGLEKIGSPQHFYFGKSSKFMDFRPPKMSVVAGDWG